MQRSSRDSAVRTWLGTEAKVVRHVFVCGDGHLAAETRSELARLGIHRDSDCLLPALRLPFVIACGDSEEDQSFTKPAQRASQEGSPLLLACITGGIVRVGPLIRSSHETFIAVQCSRPPTDPGPGCWSLPRLPEASSGLQARLGALLISAQTLKFLLGARTHCVRDRVVELNPWSMESRSYRVLKVRQ